MEFRGRIKGTSPQLVPFILKRRNENAVFGHRSRGADALTHLTAIKQRTVLF